MADIKITWLQHDTAATLVDVKISWLQLDTAAPVAADERRPKNWFKPIRDASVALPHTRARTGVRPVSVVAVDPEAVVGQFTGYMATPVAPVPTTADAHASVVLPSVAASTAARGLRVRSAACAQLPSTATTTKAHAAAVRGSAAVGLTHTRTTPAARDFDEVYAQRDISDEELLLLTSELVYN